MSGKKGKPASYQLRAIKAEETAARLARNVRDLEGALAAERRHSGWVRNLNPADQATIRDLLDALDTLALLASANRAITIGEPRVSGTTPTPPIPDFTPVWAHNLLTHTVDHLHQLTAAIRRFTHTPTPVDRHRTVCRRCKHEIDLSVRDHRFCSVCGLDRRPPPADDDETPVAPA